MRRARRSPGRTDWPRSPASSATGSSIRRDHEPIFAVILAGGSGTRLWPLARAARPKPFLPLAGGRSLMRLTHERIAPLVGRRNVLVVANGAHRPWVRREVPGIAADHLIEEEVGRDTAASIALAAHWIAARHGDGIMIVLPADHWISPAAALRTTLRRAAGAARRTGGLVTIGVRPTRPETGFGYIRPGRTIDVRVRRVASFVEKPSAALARRMAGSGRWLWNSGMFAWKASSILEELRRHSPEIAAPLERWARRAPRAGRWRVPGSVLRRVPGLSIDRAVLERSKSVLVTPGVFRWSDVGNWGAVGRLLTADKDGNTSVGGLLAVGARRCLTINEGGLSALVGVEDLVVVRSGDALLVCHKGAAQSIRDVVRRLGRVSPRHL